MKLASEDKTELVNEMLGKLQPKWQADAQKYLDEFTKRKGIKLEVDFHIDYEYYPEEDGEKLQVDVDKSKINKIEIVDIPNFAEAFDYDDFLIKTGEDFRSEKKDDEYDIFVEDLTQDIDIYDVLENVELTINPKSHVSCTIPDSYVFVLDNRSDFKEYGITPKLSQYIKSRLENKIKDDIDEIMHEYIEIELEVDGILMENSPLKVLERENKI